jgi:cellulose synthase (UDP-forming)
MYGPENEILTVWVSIVWVFYNLIILGGAVAVSVESKQVRRSHRVEMSMPAAIAREDGHLFSCTVHDYSDGGLGIKIHGEAQVLEGQNVKLLLKRGQQEYAFPVRVARVNGSEVGLQLMPLTNQQHIDFVQCTFARADTWALWQDSFPEDKPMESLLDILKLGFRGYRHLAEFSPPSVKVIFRSLTSLVAWIVSFVPRRPERAAATLSQTRQWLNNDDNAMKRKLSWICAVAVGMAAGILRLLCGAGRRGGASCGDGQPVATAGSGHCRQPADGALAAPGAAVSGERAERDVKLTLPPSRRRRAAWCCAAHPDGSVEFGMRSDELCRKRC